MTATIYEKSGHYSILVQWNEHGKRFRKNCASKRWQSRNKKSVRTTLIFFPTISDFGSKKLNLRYRLLPFMNIVFKSTTGFVLGSMSAPSSWLI